MLRGLDDLQQLLDDHVSKLQSMRASPYLSPFADAVRSWEFKLDKVQVCHHAQQALACGMEWLQLHN